MTELTPTTVDRLERLLSLSLNGHRLNDFRDKWTDYEVAWLVAYLATHQDVLRQWKDVEPTGMD